MITMDEKTNPKNSRNLGKTRVTAEQVIEALRAQRGYVHATAAALGVMPQTVYGYRKRWPRVAETWDAIREERHDKAESKLQKLIDEDNLQAIIFYLKTQARERGYVEHVDHAGKIDSEITIKFAWGEDE